MKRIFYLFLAITSFSAVGEARIRHAPGIPVTQPVIIEKPTNAFIDELPALDPNDEKWSWMDKQIEADFASIQSISERVLRGEYQRLKKTKVRCYEIRGGEVYGPRDNIRDFLEVITMKYSVPDLTFLYYCQDIIRDDFFSSRRITTPILCSAKAPRTDGKIIHFIDWYYYIYRNDSGWNKMIRDIDETIPNSPWESKDPVLFWRGGTTCKKLVPYTNLSDFPRGILVQHSLQNPSLIDAKFNWFISPSKQWRFPKAPNASIPFHLNYKYQIAMDGETATYPGYQWRLYSECLTFKQDSDETMWYYGPLKPYVHYVPVKKNLLDLIEKIIWARKHDDKAHQIAMNAREFAQENLMPEHMLLYGYKVLVKYASKMTR